MEGRKQVSKSCSSSSLTSELFGSRETYSSSSSAGLFGSIFAPTSKVLRRESFRTELKRQDYANGAWNANPSRPVNTSETSQGDVQSTPNEDMNYIYEEQRVQPSPLCSSILYGGQDIYNHPQSIQSTGVNSVYNEDDSGSASRGNWWQGSLYY
ncbi:hypothetical protein HS088_TW05G00307 [Tripterygium wilfordii]|uniref:Uncharacterized protein n=1 Tax=Tripterygium wilfordii TaxID=458696 RepID=A0A7J7DMI3_TRIWF|nr:uncharacterized protein LOC119998344 [Tripterygium wilfordii]XP_038701574.1 uncharacterized protein LOC119998344 [Tripterygium wilfordii]KAF5747582.1 hypothetical protein HS088_TW05G00307 [Tripterygium wilfordii]